METFMQCIFSGTAQGAIYGLIALGCSVIFSTIRMGHFAQGDFFMFGAFFAYQALSLWNQQVWVGVVLAVMGTTALMLLTERFVYRPMYGRTGMTLLMTTLGMQYIIQGIARIVWGKEARKVLPFFPMGTVTISLFGLNVNLSIENIMLILISAALMVVLTLFMKFTKAGLAMSAVSMNRDAARLMGVKLTTVFATTFIMAAALAAIAGMLMSPRFSVSFSMGSMVGMKAMTAAVLGGFGNMPGAMLGGVLLGIVETVCAFYLSTAYRDVFTFLVLIIVLFLYPQGILGVRKITKV